MNIESIVPSTFQGTSSFTQKNDRLHLLQPITHGYNVGGDTGYLNRSYKATNESSSTCAYVENLLSDLSFIKRVKFLLEILEDFTSLEANSFSEEKSMVLDEGVSHKSFEYALRFLIELPDKFVIPTYDLHPDGHFSFVWSEDNLGIMSVAFDEKGGVNYACYFEANSEKYNGYVGLYGKGKNLNSHSRIYSLIAEFS